MEYKKYMTVYVVTTEDGEVVDVYANRDKAEIFINSNAVNHYKDYKIESFKLLLPHSCRKLLVSLELCITGFGGNGKPRGHRHA